MIFPLLTISLFARYPTSNQTVEAEIKAGNARTESPI